MQLRQCHDAAKREQLAEIMKTLELERRHEDGRVV